VRHATGIAGLDDILVGGLPRNRLYLVKGDPGVGKTTLAMQFLLEGARRGERTLYITLSETETELRQIADSHGWSLDGIGLFELSSTEQSRTLDDENTLYASGDVDLRETMTLLLQEVDRLKPERVVFDSLSEVRLLANAPIRYRRQLLSLKQHFSGRNCTVMLLDDLTGPGGDMQVESLAHGVLVLEQTPIVYGTDRRRIRIAKLRGSTFRSGYHDYVIRSGGICVFPRLIAAEHRTERMAEPVTSGISALDALLGGGLDRSTATLIMGPVGTGKSVLTTQFACSMAGHGECVSMFLFEERVGTFRRRASALKVPIEALLESGKLRLHQVDPAELAPDEFTHLVRDEVEAHGSKLVVIDSINGYFSSMPEARFLSLQMHELLGYLSELGVVSLLTMAQSGIVGPNMSSPVDLSYLCDTLILLRYFEAEGRVRKALSILKKRSGAHEDAIRELRISSEGLVIGEPLIGMRGVLTGVPHVIDASADGVAEP